MAPNVLKRSARGLHRKRKTPKDRKQNPDKVTVTYFPGEAARILRLKATDYHQLRRLFRILAKTSPEETAAKAKKKWTWSRYEFRDLVALRTAVRLAQRAGGRLDMKSVEDTCGVLRKLFGLASPLTEVQLERMSDT